MLPNKFIRPILFPSLMFVFMEKMGHLLETYVWSDIREDKAEMLHNLRYEKLDFDFIIVGCGSSGSALARNLSRRYEVLVLDVGGAPDPFLDVPVYAFLLNSQKPVDFAHRTVPQKHAAFGLNNNVSHWPAGKQLGGSSTVHTLTYTRGNVQGFDSMASELGDGKWSTENILKYYKKIENYENGWYDEPGHHGKGGTMQIEGSPVSKFIHNFLLGASELGYRVRDPNYGRKNTEGFAYVDNHMRFGRRQDAYKGNIKPKLNLRGSKLVIRKFSLVTKINLDHQKRAIGVTYERHGRTFSPTARMEVISSAGALGTAKLLMLSGIGPKEDLEKIGIRSLVDLPVGQSLQDMYGVIMGPFTVKRGYSFVRDRDVTMQSLSRWLMFGNGPVASGRIEASFDLVSNISKAQGKDTPDIHGVVIAASADPMTSVDFERAFNLNHKSLDYFTESIGEDSFYQTIVLASPKQTGYVKLRDANPWTSLEIDPKYFQDPEDMEVLLDGMRIAIKLVETTNSMRDVKGRLWRIPFPGCESHEFTHDRISDEYLTCLARHSTMTLYRYCGTAPIGFEGDNNRVVDRNFRVIGVSNLRVVDASVLQLKNVSVSDSTVRMLGEFASDVISEYWRKRQAFESSNKFRNDQQNDIFE